jgi:taurine transport system substrate-binding protein
LLLSCLASGGYAVSKLDSGQLDLALLGSTPMAQAAARGIPLSVIYISHYMGESQGIYVRASDDSYEEIAHPFELVDRKIAVPFGSTMHYQVLFLIDLFGLSGQVEVIDMSPSEIIRAWSNKEIDGAGCWGEARDFLLKNNGDGHPNLFPAKTRKSRHCSRNTMFSY